MSGPESWNDCVVSIMPLSSAERLDEAYELTLRSLSADPDNAHYLHAMGMLHAYRSEWTLAEAALRRALHHEPEAAIWWCDLGLTLIGSGRPGQAIEPLQRSLELAPASDTLTHYGEALESAGRWAEAVQAHYRSIELDRSAIRSYERLAILYQELRFYDRSYWYAARAAKLKGFDAHSSFLLASCQFQVGKLQAALNTYRRAIKGVNADYHSGYLMALVHDSRQSSQSLRNAHEQWFLLHRGNTADRTQFANKPDPDRKLKLGYISSEFRATPGHHFILPVLESHNHENFETYCYSLVHLEDSITERYKRAASNWRQLPAGNLRELRARILEDKIDVLIDVSGHFGPHGLVVLHQRSAPVQVTYINYPCTTGCKEIDFFITDSWTTPEGEACEQQYSEHAIYRIPSGCLVYAPPAHDVETTALPALSNGYVTFGLFQRPAKFNHNFWDAVADILRQSIGSRLLVHHANRDLEEPVSITRDRILRALGKRGVDTTRIEFVALRNAREHLDVIARVDITLDTFPYSGQTTTCASLWMGVPVVSLAGSRHASRVSYSLLARLGLSDWAGTSVDEYVQIATSKASEVTALSRLRACLRKEMMKSSICRPDIVVRELEAGFRWMWNQWCASM